MTSTHTRRRAPRAPAARLAAPLALAFALGLGPATASLAAGSITFDGAPGTAAPPATLGPYTMTSFPADTTPVLTDETTLATPAGAPLSFAPAANHRGVGSGWATWSHGYTGDVYADGGTSETLTLPANTYAFYLYAEPAIFGTFSVTADGVTSGGASTSATESIDGDGGAKYMGFYVTGGDALTGITITCPIACSGFAVGEFGIAAAGTGVTPVGGATATPELSSGELVATALPIGAVLLYRRRRTRRSARQ